MLLPLIHVMPEGYLASRGILYLLSCMFEDGQGGSGGTA